MIDLWDIPDGIFMADIITARVAHGLRYAFAIGYHSGAQRELARKNVAQAAGVNKDTLHTYITPVLDDRYRIVTGPTKLAVFHSIIMQMGARPSQLYDAAENSEDLNEFLRRIAMIFLISSRPASSTSISIPSHSDNSVQQLPS
ncbi:MULTISPECIES: hypothetical protein [Asticcacaulis]|uniref:hypothetical protein n=1 Tax=Asticcacaulis TaxID=76890 RepID=UPI001AE475F4|nr:MULTISPECIES: hypothetical protein [Asticcacaulis]MBP2159070.1 hypothetical protein [Asticcacaulis solisilvae]MDR6800115.1 hypothetical protein [Asticcacaulis sp. BE141]